MNKRTSLISLLMVLALWLTGVVPAWADGLIIPVPPPDIPIHDLAPLAVKYHHVEVSIEDQVAVTKIDQVFVNESSYQLEGTYVFPLPEDASISAFAMYVDGQRLDGEVLDREQARRIYEDIVRKRRDPALLEYVGRSAFRARIFPIAPHSEKRVQLEYTQVLTLDGGLIRYVYPLDTERFSAKPIPDVRIHVDIRSKDAIKSVYSPSHDAAVDRPSDYRAVVGVEESNVKPDKDFALYYTLSGQDVGLNLLTYKPAGEDGFFLLLAAPRVQVDSYAVIAKDVMFVVDTSGSMRGEKLAQVKKALKFVLDNLNKEDRFNIIAFSTGLHPYAESMRPASERKEALQFVDELKAAGGTNIERALTEALSQSQTGRPQIVIFLTDGLPTEGVTDMPTIIEHVNKAARPESRLFAFGVGDDVNATLLDTMAQAHRGATAYVRPGQDIEAEVSGFYDKVSTPLLSDLKLNFGDVRVTDVYPDPLPDLFVGSQLVLAGRYHLGDAHGSAGITLSGEVNGQKQTFTYEDVSFRERGGESFIARLWATRRIGYLLSQIRLHGEERELVEEIVDLAVRYGIVTPYTSFLIQEDVDVLSPTARAEVANQAYAAEKAAPAPMAGAAAVARSMDEAGLRKAQTVSGAEHQDLRSVGDRTFVLRQGTWTDTTFDASKMTPQKIGFGSDTYFQFLSARPEWGVYFSLGQHVIVVLDGQAYEITEGDFPPLAPPAP
jgi:Ca-activated chloride channel homolog